MPEVQDGSIGGEAQMVDEEDFEVTDAEGEGEGEEEEVEEEEEDEEEEEGEDEAEAEEGEDDDDDEEENGEGEEDEEDAGDGKAAAGEAGRDEPGAAAATATPGDSLPSAPRDQQTAPASEVSAPAQQHGDVPDVTKVAQDVQNAALEMSNKLSASFASAFSGMGGTAPVASETGRGSAAVSAEDTFSRIAGGVSSWWSSLDPPKTVKRDETAERVSASSRATAELQELLGIAAEENLVESFKCKLLQTYGCSHNNFTPAIQMAFQGTLYITDQHTCFTVEERGRKMPFKVPHSAIRSSARHRPARKGDLSDILRLDIDTSLGGASAAFLSFKDFDSGGALDSALALVEHLSNESKS